MAQRDEKVDRGNPQSDSIVDVYRHYRPDDSGRKTAEDERYMKGAQREQEERLSPGGRPSESNREFERKINRSNKRKVVALKKYRERRSRGR